MNATATRDTTGTWRDVDLEPGRRAELLAAEMTIAEKCHQLTARMPWSVINADGSPAPTPTQVLRNPPGHIAQLILDDPAQLAAKVGTIQAGSWPRAGSPSRRCSTPRR